MSSIRFSAIPYELCKGDFITFRNANREDLRDEQYFEWRFLNRPSGKGSVIIWAEDANGDKIGSISLTPHHYSVDNRNVLIGILGDISVSKEWRGKGIARQMLVYMKGLREFNELEACLVIPNDDAARPLEKEGWKTVSTIERYIRILNPEVPIMKLLAGKPFANVMLKIVETIIDLITKITLDEDSSGYRYEFSDHFVDSFNSLWDGMDRRGLIIGKRDREYLSWRYQRHPIDKFRIFTISGKNELLGYIVSQIDGDRCQIFDIVSSGRDSFQRMLNSFISHLGSDKTLASISLRLSDQAARGLPLKRSLFLKRPDHLRFMIYSSSLQSSFASEEARWYLTLGDKDV